MNTFELYGSKKIRPVSESKLFISPEKEMHMFESVLTGSVKNAISDCGDKPIRLQFSGGCDSVALFFCLLNLTKDFACHTYVFKEGDDLRSSR